MRQRNKYQILSPDGFTIERDVQYYTSMKKANDAFKKWKKRYETQGYYSFRGGRIPLDDLEYYCHFNTIPIKPRNPKN